MSAPALTAEHQHLFHLGICIVGSCTQAYLPITHPAR